MTSQGRFIAGLVLGTAGALLFGIGGFIALVLVLGATPLALGPDGPAFVSGLLTAFGAAWLALMAIQSLTGGILSDPGPWILLGGVALVMGIAWAVRLGAPAVRRSRHR